MSSITNIIKENCHLSRYHLLYICITFLAIFLILGFRDARINDMEKKTTFYEKSVLLNKSITDQFFPEGFELTNEQVNKIEEEFEFVTTYKTTDMDTSARQHVTFTAVSPDFINTGVVSYNRLLREHMVEKIELLSGDVWSGNSVEPMVIIDEDTANSLFGSINVLGQTLPTINGDLRIIGVVTNTTERAQEMAEVLHAGQPIDETMYNTNVYIPYGYLSTLSGVESNDGSVIISDDSMEVEEIKTRLKEMLGIPQGENFLLDDREQIIYRRITAGRIFFQIIASLITVFAILEVMILISIFIMNKHEGKKPVAVSGRHFIRKSLLGGMVPGVCCSLVAANIGLYILLAGSFFPGIYLNLFNLAIIGLSIVIIYAIVVALINLATAVFTVSAISLNK
jgi:hypothetical protein